MKQALIDAESAPRNHLETSLAHKWLMSGSPLLSVKGRQVSIGGSAASPTRRSFGNGFLDVLWGLLFTLPSVCHSVTSLRTSIYILIHMAHTASNLLNLHSPLFPCYYISTLIQGSRMPIEKTHRFLSRSRGEFWPMRFLSLTGWGFQESYYSPNKNGHIYLARTLCLLFSLSKMET